MITAVARARAAWRAIVVVGLAALAACSDSSAPPTPVAIVLVGSGGLSGIVAQPIATPIQIEIHDNKGAAIKGVAFTVSVNGGGTLPLPPTKTTGGSTTLGVWTLGQTAGTQSLQVQAGALSLTINATALPAAPATATPNGLPQSATGTVGGVSTLVPTIKVADGFGNPISGLSVLVSVTGGGTLQTASPVTNSSGVATVGSWTYGTAAGTQSVTLTAPGVLPVVFAATVSPGAAVSETAASAVTGNGSAGVAAPFQPSIKVIDAFGNGVSNVAVTVTVSAGGVVQFSNPLTNAFGIATTGVWTLSITPGVNTVTMAAPGFTPVTFTVTASANPATVLITAGKFQTAAPSTALAVSPVFKVLDNVGNGLPGVTVQFATTFGGGSLGVASATTDAQGQASPGVWTLGTTTGSQTIRATAGTVTQTLYATALATGSTAFNLQIRYIGTPPSAAIQAAFTAGAARIAQEVTAHLSAVPTGNVNVGQCFQTAPAGAPTINETITDNVMYVNIGPIDGVNGILGATGPCLIRTSNGLPLLSTMTLDDADVNALLASGALNSTVLHEMHHALGYGSLWSGVSFIPALISGAGTSSPFYLGAAGNKAYAAAGGIQPSGIPIENTGGTGTRDSHWKETAFRTELLTGFLDNGVPNPLSAMSIMSLADFGYAVSTASADPYTLPFGAVKAAVQSPATSLTDIVLSPKFAIDDAGRITPIPPIVRSDSTSSIRAPSNKKQ